MFYRRSAILGLASVVTLSSCSPRPSVATAVPTLDSGVLAGCQQKRKPAGSGVEGRDYRCGTVIAEYMVWSPSVVGSPHEALSAALVGMRSALKRTRIEAKPAELTLGDRPWPAVLIRGYTDQAVDAASFEGLLVAAWAGSELRTASCVILRDNGSEKHRCRAILERLLVPR